jgi:hypothetical protein
MSEGIAEKQAGIGGGVEHVVTVEDARPPKAFEQLDI